MKAKPKTPEKKDFPNELSKSDLPTKRRAWGTKRRLAQRARIYKVKPWLRACGPRTPDGRTISAQNARKSGVYDARHHYVRRALRRHSRFLKLIRLNRYKSFPDWLMQEGRRVTAELLLACHLFGALSVRHES